MGFSWQGRMIYKPSERIDKSGINRCCDDIIKAAQKLKTASEEIKAMADDFSNPQLLQINNQVYSKSLDEYSVELMNKYKTLHNVVCPTIKRMAEERYKQEESDYADYVAWLDAIEAEQRRASGSNGGVRVSGSNGTRYTR